MNSRLLTGLRRPCCTDDAGQTAHLGVDDIAVLFAHGQIVFFVWVTLIKHKWVNFAKRRRMWFDPQLDVAFEHGFAPGIRDAGFEPHRIDQAKTNRGISDEILARIRTCEFVVADFTGQRQSVYFEAGFARGLGKEVIWCCRSEEISKLHFDTKHLGHVAWNDPHDLRTKIRESIQANIVRRLPGVHDALFSDAGPYLHRKLNVHQGSGPGT